MSADTFPKIEPCDGRLVAGGAGIRLPGMLDQVHRALGLALTLRFIDAFGGGDLHIPATMPSDHPVVETVGPKAAAVLAQTLGRDRWDPYRVPSGHVELTWYFSRVYRVQGLSVMEIRKTLLWAHALRVTERRIRALVTDIRPACGIRDTGPPGLPSGATRAQDRVAA